MTVTLRMPDELASRFGSTEEMERRALEALALDEFRLGRMTRAEMRRLLSLASRADLGTFLITHGVVGSFGNDDLERDRADLKRVGL
jgi:hypothetical protein